MNCDVLVVGAGPVGSAMAAMLSRFAPRETVLVLADETSCDPRELVPRAVGMDDESIRNVIQRLGMLERFQATTTRASMMQYVTDWSDTTAVGAAGVTNDASSLPRVLFGDPTPPGRPGAWAMFKLTEELGPNGYPRGPTAFWQPLLTSDLRLRACERVQLLARHRLVAITPGPSGVMCTFRVVGSTDSSNSDMSSSSASDMVKVCARFVVGCDGTRSFVRQACLPPMRALDDYDEQWMVVDLLARESLVRGKITPFFNQRLKTRDGRQMIFVTGTNRVPEWPADTIHIRIDFEIIGSDIVKPGVTEEINDAELVARVLRPFGIVIATLHDPKSRSPFHLVRAVRYRLNALVSETWSAPERGAAVFVAGDAAHCMPMFMGQGLNQGMRDVACLAWRLCSVLGGRARSQLLDMYQVDRAPIAREIVQLSCDRGRLDVWNSSVVNEGQSVPGGQAHQERSAVAMRPVVSRLRATRPRDELAGSQFPQFASGSDDVVFGTCSLDPVLVDLTPDGAVIARGLDERSRWTLRAVGCRLVQVHGVLDPYQHLARFAEVCDCAILTPDAVVVGSARLGGVDELVQCLAREMGFDAADDAALAAPRL